MSLITFPKLEITVQHISKCELMMIPRYSCILDILGIKKFLISLILDILYSYELNYVFQIRNKCTTHFHIWINDDLRYYLRCPCQNLSDLFNKDTFRNRHCVTRHLFDRKKILLWKILCTQRNIFWICLYEKKKLLLPFSD